MVIARAEKVSFSLMKEVVKIVYFFEKCEMKKNIDDESELL
jgi:hypothetical protein